MGRTRAAFFSVGMVALMTTVVADGASGRHHKPPVPVEVMNFPGGSGSEVSDQYFSVFVHATWPARPVTVVPPDRALIITDIDGVYSCGYCAVCTLADSGGRRIVWNGDTHRSYTTGLRFGPREVVQWLTTCGPGQVPLGDVTFMGKLVASPSGAFVDG